VRARDVERQTRRDRKGQTKAKEPITFSARAGSALTAPMRAPIVKRAQPAA
jgi:hypothetical protein